MTPPINPKLRILALTLALSISPLLFAANLVRGPYLQIVTPTSIVIKWRTDVSTDSIVRYGLAANTLNDAAIDVAIDVDHEVKVTGLTPGTLYYYSVGDSGATLAGGDNSYKFQAAPRIGARHPTRIWVIGDSGTANSGAAAVRDGFMSFTVNRPANIWLMLGDNAYTDGTDFQYQLALFDMYPPLLRQTPLWPTLGNHDGVSANSSNESGPYFDIFTLPRNAEAGGLASGTEAYYSFDYGNIHFINLDSYDSDRSESGAMFTWLENDLAATTQEWIIGYWHHPPYSKGSHNSDSESHLIDMRTRALPILEFYGVDFVLTGHSHSYERSYLIDGHYGTSDTFDSSMLIDGGSGRENDTGAYTKISASNPHQGTVYAVAGSSGHAKGGSLDHPVMFSSLNSLGSLVLDVNGGRLDANFIDEFGNTLDFFTIIKDAPSGDNEPPTPPANLAATEVIDTAVTLAWDAGTDNVAVTGHRISRDGQVLSTANALSYQDSTLQPATTYSYSVRAVDAAGNESIASNLSVTTLASVDNESPTSRPSIPADNESPTSRQSIIAGGSIGLMSLTLLLTLVLARRQRPSSVRRQTSKKH
jgi:hypothetical protein